MKEKEQMTRRYAIAALVLFVGLTTASLGKAANKELADKKALAPGSYCHKKFPAIVPQTLGTHHPMLSKDDFVDFYGPCDQLSIGPEQLSNQRREDFLSRQRN